MAKKNIAERTKMVEAMEYICRQLNNENHLITWFMAGVADGDIEYGEFDANDQNAQYYAKDDDNFAELMQLFLNIMARAKKSGGLYCDGVVSGIPQD